MAENRQASKQENLVYDVRMHRGEDADFSLNLERYGVPHYLKIDIEGMDTECLKALLPFDVRPDYVSIESDKLSFDKLL